MATAKTTKSNETKNTSSATAKKTVKPANKTAKKSTGINLLIWEIYTFISLGGISIAESLHTLKTE